MKIKLGILLLFLAGILIFCYPAASNYLEERNHAKIIESYSHEVTEMKEAEIGAELARAEAYNRHLGASVLIDPFTEDMGEKVTGDYLDILDVGGVMGRIRIPGIGVDLPVYHGTSQEVLQKGVGHLKNTSFPVGGPGTHAVLSGHRGLPSATLFSRLDQVKEGDKFYLEVLNRSLCYRVDQIKTVLPQETSDLEIMPEKDYVTLVTCTPYGVNTHRLLVRGERFEEEEKTETEAYREETAEGRREDMMKNKILYAAAGLIFLVGLLVFLYPTFSAWRTGRGDREKIRQYEQMLAEEEQEEENPESREDADGSTPGKPSGEGTQLYRELRRAMEAYNREIYENGQNNLKDPFSYEEPSFDLKEWGIEEEMFGYLTIPAMDLSLPVYLGATKDNMAKGAGHLSQTSLPIGGENTNAVIAAHRGYAKAPMFRHIEKLKAGDEVTIRNLWETLTYRVTEIKIIYPQEVDQVLIQKDRDLLTLITCHPYTQNSRRYVVCCQRE